jgi:hypothetical protein
MPIVAQKAIHKQGGYKEVIRRFLPLALKVANNYTREVGLCLRIEFIHTHGVSRMKFPSSLP